MGTRRTRFLAIVAAAAAAVVLISLPARPQEPTATTVTFKVAPEGRVVDLLGPGFSAGDIILSRGVGADPDSGAKVGRLTTRCQRTKVAADSSWAWLLCDGELRTPSGSLTFAGTRRQGEDHPTGTFAITGGTGDYSTAGGTVSTEDDAGRNTWTFEIVDQGDGGGPPQ